MVPATMERTREARAWPAEPQASCLSKVGAAARVVCWDWAVCYQGFANPE
jgi:hypothetical protein